MGEKVPEPMKDLDMDLQDTEKGETCQVTGVTHGSRPSTHSQRLSQKDNGHQPRTPLDQCQPKNESLCPPNPPPTRAMSVKSSSRLGTTHSAEPMLSSASSDGRDTPNHGAVTPRKHGSRDSSRASRTSSREQLHPCKGAEDIRIPNAEGDDNSGTECQPGIFGKNVSCIPSNIRHKFGSSTVDQLVTEEQARRAIYEVIEGQKRVSRRASKIRNSMESSPFADYYELGYNMRSNIFQVARARLPLLPILQERHTKYLEMGKKLGFWQPNKAHPPDILQNYKSPTEFGVLTGPPMELKSLMKDSYTADVIKRAVRDPQHWHGRKTDDLGRWHQKNALDMNLQKALDQKIGERSKNLK